MFDYGALHFVRCCEIFFGIILDKAKSNRVNIGEVIMIQ